MTDAQWAKMEPHCLGKPTDPGRSGRDNRLFMEAVLWIVRTGSPWRDIPAILGTGARRSDGFAIGGKPMFSSGFSMPYRRNRTWNMPWLMPPSLRSTGTARAQKGAQSQAIGRSKGGMTTKILALTDVLGNLVRFHLMPGHCFDTIGVAPLIEGVEFGGP